jgi:hypothetical protein
MSIIKKYINSLGYKYIDITTSFNIISVHSYVMSLLPTNKNNIVLAVKMNQSTNFFLKANTIVTEDAVTIVLFNKDNYVCLNEDVNYKLIINNFLKDTDCVICLEEKITEAALCPRCSSKICKVCYSKYKKTHICPICKYEYEFI